MKEAIKSYEIVFKLNGFLKITSILAVSESQARSTLCSSCGPKANLDIRTITDKGVYS